MSRKNLIVSSLVASLILSLTFKFTVVIAQGPASRTMESEETDPRAAALKRGDYETAARLTAISTSAGRPLAQLLLGIYYQDGKGVRKDPQTGADSIEKAAIRENPWQEARIGQIFAGYGRTEDPILAAQWYEKAAAHGGKRFYRKSSWELFTVMVLA